MLNRIPGTVKCYASVDGKVYRSLANGNIKEVKPHYRPKDGYGLVVLKTDKGRKPFYVHRCVCSAFKIKDKPDVNHIDGNKRNNHISNLEWVTKKENMLHAAENNLTAKGHRNGLSRLSKEQVEYIRSVNTSARKLGRELSVSHGTILKARNYITYRGSNV